jgi:tetratricopeptide (TPR) repeat protein
VVTIVLGNVQVNAGRYEDGLRLFNDALRVNPRHARALIGRGSIWALKSQLDDAISDLSLALEYDPTNKDAMTRLGQTYAARGDLTNALRVLSMACEAGLVTKNDANIFYQRAMIYHRLGDYFGAVADLSRCVELEPALKQAWSMLGQCKTSLGDCQEALVCVPLLSLLINSIN